MKKLLALAAVALLAGCSGTGMYHAPDSGKTAQVKVANHIDESKKANNSDNGGWQMPMGNTPSRAGVFKVDGDRTKKEGGDQSAVLEPGQHTIQIYADDGGILRFGELKYNFQANHKYEINVYASQKAETNYRIELVDVAQPDKVLTKEAF